MHAWKIKAQVYYYEQPFQGITTIVSIEFSSVARMEPNGVI